MNDDEIVDYCLQYDDLSEWEYDFLTDMEDRLSDGKELTDNQRDKLCEIHAKVMDVKIL